MSGDVPMLVTQDTPAPRPWVSVLPFWGWVLCAVAFVCCLAGPLLPDRIVGTSLTAVGGACCPLAIAIGVRRYRPVGATAWQLVSAGELLWVAESLRLVLVEVHRMAPQLVVVSAAASLGPILQLSAFVPFAGAILVFERARWGRRMGAAQLDSVVLILGMTTLLYVLTIAPLLDHNRATNGTTAALVATPVADLVLLGALFWMHQSPMRRVLAVRLMMVALIAMLLNGVWQETSMLTGHSLPRGASLLWAPATAAMVAVPMHPSMRGLTETAPAGDWQFSALRTTLLVAGLLCPSAAVGCELLLGASVSVPVIVLAGACQCLVVCWRLVRLMRGMRQQTSDLADLASRDHLTGLINRRSADAALVSSMALVPAPRRTAGTAARPAQVSLAMLDIDHFKRHNDRFGHQAGDQLLIEVAASWTAELREPDLLARYGGEEFLLVCFDRPVGEVRRLVDRLREVMPDQQSISAGIATWDRRESIGSLIGRADGALYRAKHSGRARTVLAGEEIETANTDLPVSAAATAASTGRSA